MQVKSSMDSSLVEGSNNPPVDFDDNDSTAKDIAVTIDVAANDSDPDGKLDPVSAITTCATCSDPTTGSLLNHGDGTFSYAPKLVFTGPDSFVYEICDKEHLCDTATVDITVTVVESSAPVITLLGANPLIVEFGSTFTDSGATAADDVVGNLRGSIAVGGDTVNTSALGSYTITYDVSDSAGNAAIQVTRTVNVVDTTQTVPFQD